jgi:hypothetical protein
MARTKKLSVSMTAEDARWIQTRAKRSRRSVSALLSEAVARFRQQEARQAFLAKLSPEERASPAEVQEIRREWREG